MDLDDWDLISAVKNYLFQICWQRSDDKTKSSNQIGLDVTEWPGTIPIANLVLHSIVNINPSLKADERSNDSLSLFLYSVKAVNDTLKSYN